MGSEASESITEKIFQACEMLHGDKQLITVKNVMQLLDLSEIDNPEAEILAIINQWRLCHTKGAHSKSVDERSMAQKLLNAEREIKFLRAKLKAINSYYHRQRQELIMKIESMLYK